MRETTPQVYLIAEPRLAYGMQEYLNEVGGYDWFNHIIRHTKEPGVELNQGETLVEFAGRLCYRSWKAGLNANVTKIRTDRSEYFANVLVSGHGSILEHANYSFVFHDVSRVFTHELVRHRAGVAISQESLRYVRLTDLGFRIPPVLKEYGGNLRIVELVETLEEFQRDIANVFDLDNPELPFAVKKEVTSALRRLAPLGLSTGMLWTANLRTLRHVIKMRTELGAEEEIRTVFLEIAKIMQKKCPLLFQDMIIQDDGVCHFEYPKV